MSNPAPTKPWLFCDDGQPESRDYDDNYTLVEPQEPRGSLLLPCSPRREPQPPRALRIVPSVEPVND